MKTCFKRLLIAFLCSSIYSPIKTMESEPVEKKVETKPTEQSSQPPARKPEQPVEPSSRETNGEEITTIKQESPSAPEVTQQTAPETGQVTVKKEGANVAERLLSNDENVIAGITLEELKKYIQEKPIQAAANITLEVFSKMNDEQMLTTYNTLMFETGKSQPASDRANELFMSNFTKMRTLTTTPEPASEEEVANIRKISRFFASVIRFTHVGKLISLPLKSLYILTSGADQFIGKLVLAAEKTIKENVTITNPLTWLKEQEAELQKELNKPGLDPADRAAIYITGRLSESLFAVMGTLWLGKAITRGVALGTLKPLGFIFSKTYRLGSAAQQAIEQFPELKTVTTLQELKEVSNKRRAELNSQAKLELQKYIDDTLDVNGVNVKLNKDGTASFEMVTPDKLSDSLTKLYQQYDIAPTASWDARRETYNKQRDALRMAYLEEASTIAKKYNATPIIPAELKDKEGYFTPFDYTTSDKTSRLDRGSLINELDEAKKRWSLQDNFLTVDFNKIAPTPAFMRDKTANKAATIRRKTREAYNSFDSAAGKISSYLKYVDEAQAAKEKLFGKSA